MAFYFGFHGFKTHSPCEKRRVSSSAVNASMPQRPPRRVGAANAESGFS